jgi:type II secretory pathway pseudopilin PulG
MICHHSSPGIAAIAIPNLLRARIAANESSAAASIRTINTAQIQYQATYPTVGYSATLGALGPGAGACPTPPTSATSCLIDNVLATGTKSGYLITMVGSAAGGAAVNNQYHAEANPQVPNQTGNRGFCSIEDAVVRYNTGNIATCAGTYSPLQ